MIKNNPEISFDEMNLRHYRLLSNDIFSVESKTSDYTQDVGIFVNDGSTFIGDYFTIIISSQDPPQQIATPSNVHLIGTGTAVRSGNNIFSNYDTLEVSFTDPDTASIITLSRTFSQADRLKAIPQQVKQIEIKNFDKYYYLSFDILLARCPSIFPLTFRISSVSGRNRHICSI